MQQKDLSSSSEKEVSSFGMLDVRLGAPTTHLLIFTGIAIPDWDSQRDLDYLEVTVHLGLHVTAILNYAAQIGLASIENDDTDFVFTTESVAIEQPDDELLLKATIAVRGEPSVLHRFSFQATVEAEIDEPLIAGRIRWTPGVITVDPNVHPLFSVSANVAVSAPPGSPPSFQPQFQSVATATDASPPTTTGDQIEVPYLITGVPLDTPLTVVPQQLGGLHVASGMMGFSPALTGPITLTGHHLEATGVDFEIVVSDLPH